MDFVERVQRTQFLGIEFLTWLWYQEELNDGLFKLGGEIGDIEVWFEDKLTMGSTALDEQQDVFKGGRPSTSPEARSALKLGKMAQSARIRIIHGEQEWELTLKAEPLCMSAIKLPEVLAKETHAHFFERMFLLEHLDRLFKTLYQSFLELRLSAEWTQTILPNLQTWVAQR